MKVNYSKPSALCKAVWKQDGRCKCADF